MMNLPVKLRASCDACNEAKVRCSQTKPVCARCQKQGFCCVFGLSRRSHKTAPRVGSSSRSPHGTLQLHTPQPSMSSPSLSHRCSLTSQGDAFGSPRNQSPDLFSISALDEFTFPPGVPSMSVGAVHHDIPFISYNGMPQFSIASPSPILSSRVSATISEQPQQQKSQGQRDTLSDSGLGNFTQNSPSATSCTSRIIMKLASMPLLLMDEKTSLDMHLSQLKLATKFAEHCFLSSDTDWDDFTILAISMLIGHIITGFDRALEAITVSLSAMPSPINSPSAREIYFSWGALHIDNDDESIDLRHHLWLMQFQKAEGLLKRLDHDNQRMRHQQPVQAFSQKIMASEYLHMWLSQRMQLVKRKFTNSMRRE